MTTAFVLRTILELGAILLIIYGLFHEKALIRLEDRILRFLAHRVRSRQKAKLAHRESSHRALPRAPHNRPEGPKGGEPRRVA